MEKSERSKLSALLHTLKKRFADNRQIILFPFIAFAIYFALKEAFWAYAGLVDPGGTVYSPFLAKYNLIQVILDCLVYPIKFILNSLGFETITFGNQVSIKGAGGVRIFFPCLGVEMMIALVALIIAYPVKRKKLVFIILGIVAIHLLNIARLLSIIYASSKYPGKTSVFHDYFNDVAYLVAFFFFYLWLIYVSPKEKEKK